MITEYMTFLERKAQVGADHGFEPLWMPSSLFEFQVALTQWALRKGRGAIFADCGLGKTVIQLTWAENVARKTNNRVLILAPLAVGAQTVREGEKFGIECTQVRDGTLPVGKKIIVTNYEKLHLFSPTDFAACVCDESSILKHFTGATQKQVTRFMCKLPYRLLCTATAAPNDYVELGTSSEALGELNYSEMLTRFFRQLDDKGQKREGRQQEREERIANHFGRLSFRVHQSIGEWRLKHHAVVPFWRWVCSWAIACRQPKDLGYDDGRFILPPLNEHYHVIKPTRPPTGMLFTVPALGLREEREERRRTLDQRCEFVAQLVNHKSPAVAWCHLNEEGKTLARVIPGAVEVSGATPDEAKEEIYRQFADKAIRVLIIKPKIGAWGLNWQHCAHIVTFASHSYEQFYQSVRRCWRFGQTKPVRLDIIATQGEVNVRNNMMRKANQAAMMFGMLVKHMKEAQSIHEVRTDIQPMEVPLWLSATK